MITRRDALRFGAYTTALLSCPSLAFAKTPGEHRLVVIILRGGLDGLSALIPHGDRHLRAKRAALVPEGGQNLDGHFALHPALKTTYQLYQAREALFIPAIASPYRQRSHFDAQDVLEGGGLKPHERQSGWLNRAVAEISGTQAISLGAATPLLLRGEAQVLGWSPPVLKQLNEDTLDRLSQLYEGDDVLSMRLNEALTARDIADDSMATQRGRRNSAAQTAQVAARFLSEKDGPRIASFDMGGWDTHANQKGRLNNQLRQLDAVFAALKSGLGSHWQNTTVLAISEFGRTVAANGTQGTDHGTGGLAFVLGGAVQGGRILGDWPGLNQLHEGRDLRPTTDMRALLKSALASGFQISEAALAEKIFAASRNVKPLDGLLRT